MHQLTVQFREKTGIGQQTGFAVERQLAALGKQGQQGGTQAIVITGNLQQLQHPAPPLQSLIAVTATIGPYRIKQLHQQR